MNAQQAKDDANLDGLDLTGIQRATSYKDVVMDALRLERELAAAKRTVGLLEANQRLSTLQYRQLEHVYQAVIEIAEVAMAWLASYGLTVLEESGGYIIYEHRLRLLGDYGEQTEAYKAAFELAVEKAKMLRPIEEIVEEETDA